MSTNLPSIGWLRHYQINQFEMRHTHLAYVKSGHTFATCVSGTVSSVQNCRWQVKNVKKIPQNVSKLHKCHTFTKMQLVSVIICLKGTVLTLFQGVQEARNYVHVQTTDQKGENMSQNVITFHINVTHFHKNISKMS